MDIRELSRRAEAVRARHVASPAPPDAPPSPSLDELLATLDATLRGLQAAQEEIRRQGARLASAQQEAEAEHDRYRDLFDLAPVGYLTTDRFGAIREANRAAVEILCIPLQHIRGKPLAVFLPPEARAAFRQELYRLRRADRLDEFATRMVPRGGAPVQVVLSATVARDRDEAPSEIRWALHDVTARVESERKIRALNALLEESVVDRTAQLREQIREHEGLLIATHAAEGQGPALLDLVQGLDAIIWKADAATGRFTFASRRAEELLGYPIERWTAEPDFWASIVHPEDREWAVKNRSRAVAEGRDHEAEYRLVAADGHFVWFRESVRVNRSEDGQPAELRGLMVNIGRRKKVERQLQAAKQRLTDELSDLSYVSALFDRLSPTTAIAPLTEEILESLASIVGAVKGAAFVRHAFGSCWTLAASLGLPESVVQASRTIPDGSPWIGRTLAVDAPIVIEDVLAVPGYSLYLDTIRAAEFRALFSLPLRSLDDECLGSLVVLFEEPHRPHPRQGLLAERYARKAAEFVEAALRRDEPGRDSP